MSGRLSLMPGPRPEARNRNPLKLSAAKLLSFSRPFFCRENKNLATKKLQMLKPRPPLSKEAADGKRHFWHVLSSSQLGPSAAPGGCLKCPKALYIFWEPGTDKSPMTLKSLVDFVPKFTPFAMVPGHGAALPWNAWPRSDSSPQDVHNKGNSERDPKPEMLNPKP